MTKTWFITGTSHIVSARYERRLATWGEHRELAIRAHVAVR
jgi:hypothetical protein